MITLRNAVLRVQINPFGAELSSVQYQGRERMWQGDPSIWSGRAPVLFPVAGSYLHDEYIHEGVTYAMEQHGFARRRTFETTALSESSVSLSLCTAESNYPFDYRLTVTFSLTEDTPCIRVDYRVENLGTREMYYTLGAHEAYACPKGIGGCELVFSDDTLLERSILSGAQITHETETYCLPEKTLALSTQMFHDNTLVFGSLRSRSVTLRSMLSAETVRVDYPDFPCLLIWQKEGAPYLCIEPWTNTPEYTDHDKYLIHKPGVQKLLAGEEKRYLHTITFG